MSQAEKQIMTIQFPKLVVEKVDEIAARLERSRNWIVKQAVSDWIAKEEEKDRLTREALADVDMGLVTDHSEMVAWVEGITHES